MTDPAAVPAELVHVRAFLNTLDVDEGTDAIETARGLRDWLHEHGLLAARAKVSQADVTLARRLRAALRDLARAQHDRVANQNAAADLNRLAGALPMRVVAADDGSLVLAAAGSGVGGALAQLLADLAVAHTTGSCQRLKICSADDCQWAFYDQSKNRSGRWCSMAVCGNRTKTRTYRRRHQPLQVP